MIKKVPSTRATLPRKNLPPSDDAELVTPSERPHLVVDNTARRKTARISKKGSQNRRRGEKVARQLREVQSPLEHRHSDESLLPQRQNSSGLERPKKRAKQPGPEARKGQSNGDVIKRVEGEREPMEMNPTQLKMQMKVPTVGAKKHAARVGQKQKAGQARLEFDYTVHDGEEQNDVYVASEDDYEGGDDRCLYDAGEDLSEDEAELRDEDCGANSVEKDAEEEAHDVEEETEDENALLEPSVVKQATATAPSSNGGHLLSEDVAILRRVVLDESRDVRVRIDGSDCKTAKGFDGLQKKVDDMYVLMTELLAFTAMSNLTPNRSNRQIVLDTRISIISKLINDEMLQNVTEQVLMSVMMKQFKGLSCMDFAESGAKVVNMMYFSRQPNEKFEKFATEDGLRHSRYRRGIMLSLLRALQMDSFGFFMKESVPAPVTFTNCREVSEVRSVSVTEGESSKNGSGEGRESQTETAPRNGMKTILKGRLKQPPLLRPGYITLEHCDTAAALKEGRKSLEKKKKEKGDAMISREEIALNAAIHLYSIITNALHENRAAGKAALFEGVSYLFVSWAETGIRQDTLSLKWKEEGMSKVSYADLPIMETMDFLQRKRQICEDDGEMGTNHMNNKKLAETTFQHEHLVLIAEYDVVIREDNASSAAKRSGELETRRMTREINLVKVACRFIAGYSGMSPSALTSTYLSCNRNSFRNAFAVALFLKELCTPYIDQMREYGVTWKDDDETFAKRTVVHSVSMFDLLPALTKRKTMLVSNLLRLTDIEYQVQNVSGTVVPDHRTEEDLGCPEPIALDEDYDIVEVKL